MADSSDHALAFRVASETGELLERMLDKSGHAQRGWRSFEYEADQAAHNFIVKELAEHRPNDAILSEEGRDLSSRLSAAAGMDS